MKNIITKMSSEFIPFSKPSIGNEEITAVNEVLRSGWLTTGPKTQEFETLFKSYVDSKYALAVNSCTAGLHLSLHSLGISKGDEVITTPLTFAATANTIVHCGAKPVFADIEKETLNIDPYKIEEKITSKTKAIVVVHYGGHPCEMDKISEICNKYNLRLVEDCAHAVGAEYNGKKAGTFGDSGVFSFYSTKNITTGEGGMVVTNSSKLAKKMKVLRLHGMSKDAWNRYGEKGKWYYDLVDAGFKYNMSDIQAALGVEQLKKVEKFNEKRQIIARRYSDCFMQLTDFIQIPAHKENVKHSWHLYPIILKKNTLQILRDQFINKLSENNIGCSVHFIPLHLQHFYQKQYFYKTGDFPVSEEAYSGLISLPIYPTLETNQLEYIINKVYEIVEHYGRK